MYFADEKFQFYCGAGFQPAQAGSLHPNVAMKYSEIPGVAKKISRVALGSESDHVLACEKP